MVTSSARASANDVRSPAATSATILSISFLLAAALMGGFSCDLMSGIIARPSAFFQSMGGMIYIHSMNLKSLDLNLLVALDALLLEGNVSRAAMRIGLSQPATSHALQRLRDLI